MDGVSRIRRRFRRSAVVLVAVALAAVVSGCALGYSAPATDVTTTDATLHGNVASFIDGDVSYWFAYGTTTAYVSETTHRTITIHDRVFHPVSEPLNGLSPGTDYHYRVCAQYPGAPVSCGVDEAFTTTPVTLAITASPALYPAFDPAVSDYVTRCGSGPVTMSVKAPSGTTVAINGQPAQGGIFNQDVQLAVNHAFAFTTTAGGQTSTYHVRCLPADFPDWTYTRAGTPKAPFYVTTPQSGTTPGGQPATRYVAIFDDHGVPVWWRAAPATDAKLQADGTLSWYTPTAGGTSTPGVEIRRLDGTLVKTWRTVGSDTDIHDFQLLANGDALMTTYPTRPGTVDLTPYGITNTNTTVQDGEIQEIAPDGSLVWSWSTKDHIPPSETGTRWWGFMPNFTASDGRQVYDYAHVNSIQQVGNTIVASFRHFDAVYAIDKTTGNIVYKLGGTTRPESLTVTNDPQSYPLGGQHFARVLSDGTLTVHDNRTFLTGALRAVRYKLDLTAKTAQLLEQITDSDATSSFCCGSAQRFDDGSWLMSWGSTPVVTEFAPGGTRDFELRFAGSGISYRVAPITGATPTVADLRAGMDTMTSP